MYTLIKTDGQKCLNTEAHARAQTNNRRLVVGSCFLLSNYTVVSCFFLYHLVALDTSTAPLNMSMGSGCCVCRPCLSVCVSGVRRKRASLLMSQLLSRFLPHSSLQITFHQRWQERQTALNLGEMHQAWRQPFSVMQVVLCPAAAG